MKKSLGVLVLAASLVAGGQAQAAGCWSEAAYEAAQMRDFDTMLMVATLRCRITGVDFSADYNRFVRDKRPILADANQQLRGQFALSVGQARALGAYDDYMTKVANGYGGGAKGMTCQDYAALAHSAAQAPSVRAELVKIAARAGSAPRLPGQRCGSSVAMNGDK
jgi:hypothetical protein